MQGLITLDFGNTHPHAGLFHKDGGKWELVKIVPWNELPIFLTQTGMNPDNSQLVLCEVKAREEELLPLLKQGFLLTRLKSYWRGERFAGMPVNYAKTLGEDRLIGAHYCYKTNKTSTLIIDAGTYVTMDLLNESGFQGGYILPGTEAYFSSFSKGDRLRDLSLNASLSSGLPHDTIAAIRDGYNAFGSFALEMIRIHNIKKVVLTGGTAPLWESFFLKENLEIKKEPHLIHWALLHWMTTQIEPL